MANPEHVAILKKSVEAWNKWRRENPDVIPYLREAYLRGLDLRGANLYGADLIKASLSGANLIKANLCGAHLRGADLSGAYLMKANLSDAYLIKANLFKANLREADLNRADLSRASLIETNLSKAILSDCRIFGISAWDLNLVGAIQADLVITQRGEPIITVDNLEIAQFVYLLLHNAKIRDVIDTIGKKAVLILGQFNEERKAVLDAIREELRRRDYIPILFDFEKPASRDLTETISTLAHLSRFIIADITDAKSIPQELQAIVPNLPSLAVQPIILAGQHEYAMFEHFKRYPWVLPIHPYQDADELIAALPEKVINPAEAKANEMRPAGG